MADSSFYEALFYLILGVVLDRTLGRGIDWVVTKVMKKVEARVDDPRHLLWKLIIQPPANVAGLLLSFFALVWLVFPVWGLLTQTVPNPGTSKLEPMDFRRLANPLLLQ